MNEWKVFSLRTWGLFKSTNQPRGRNAQVVLVVFIRSERNSTRSFLSLRRRFNRFINTKEGAPDIQCATGSHTLPDLFSLRVSEF